MGRIPARRNYFSILIRPENTPATNHYYGLQIFSNNMAIRVTGTTCLLGRMVPSLNWALEYSTNYIVGDTTNTVFFDSYSSTRGRLESNGTAGGARHLCLG